jgi:hypothetical protein
MSICFLEANYKFRHEGLPEDQYIAHLVAHFRKDVSHAEDKQRGKYCANAKEFLGMKLYAQSIRHAAVSKRYERLDSTAELQSIFQACLNGHVEAVKNGYEELRQPEQVPFLPPLATLAVHNGQAEILKFCLEKGVVADEYLKLAVQRCSNIEIFEVLYAANWRGMQNSPQVMGQMARGMIRDRWYTTSEVLEWFLDHGASIRGKTVKDAISFFRPSAVLMRNLVELGSKAAISPEALAYAASCGYTDIVKQLLDAGLPADATPLPMHDMDLARDGPHKTALFHAVTGNNRDLMISDAHLETARLLLDNGAGVDRTCGYDLETPISVALTLRKNQRTMRKLLLSYPDNVDKPTPTSSQRKRRRL